MEPLFPGLDEIPDPAARVARHLARLPARLPTQESELSAEDSPTRPQRRRLLAFAGILSVGWIAGVVAWSGLRSDIGTPVTAASLVMLVVLAVVAAAWLMRPGRYGLPPGLRVVQALTLGLPAGFAALALLDAQPGGAVPLGATRACMLLGSFMALVPFSLAVLLLRRSLLTAPSWRGAAVGALSALLGAIGIHACCGCNALDHVLLGHGLPILGGLSLGAAAGAAWGRV
ncbi:NrsF family protein [Chondromyces apiculatus]|uniref:DUF1109 domain-containing protein n=1 Tax=Chondromyces apiculatus DSM 436 TaxID=1192034 RepID=A0A017SW40_9BACT|nr:NrsF family protein [Chondromyces apiculatus]EYF01198.1 Hypothetical protein CAP_8539 [Chondromyces apiculatus DSM 436]